MQARCLRLALLLAVAPLALPAATAAEAVIEQAVRQSYIFHTVLEGNVIVKAYQGQVTLSGTVADNEEKLLALATVENTPGVTDVTNNIRVLARYTARTDSWIAVQIRNRLLVRAGVSPVGIVIFVRDGVVTLKGTVPSLTQKELTAVYAAQIDSVKSVRNDLAISDQPAARETIDDPSVTAQVQVALRANAATSGLKPAVSTANGVIHITGEASAAEVALVTRLAQEVRGAVSVVNAMVVKGGASS